MATWMTIDDGTIPTMAQSVILTLLANFDSMSEADIAALENGPSGLSRPREERALLYALRVSRCVPTLKKLPTLASRVGIAHRGAGGFGLDAARASPHWQVVREFLSSLYLARFNTLAGELLRQTESAVRVRRGLKPTVRIERATQELNEAVESIATDIPAIRKHADRWIRSLSSLRT